MSEMISETHAGACIPIIAGDDSSPQSVNLSEELQDALQSVEHRIEELNAALRQAVDAGATVELRRRGRVHSGDAAGPTRWPRWCCRNRGTKQQSRRYLATKRLLP